MEAVKYPAEVEQFFSDNPEATDCFVALGYALATREAAEKKLAGVKGHMPMRYVRQAGLMHEKDSDAMLELVIKFEEEVEKAHLAFDLLASDDNMNAWKDAQKSLEKAKAEYDRIRVEEKKLEADKPKVEGEVNDNEGSESHGRIVTEEDLVANPDLAATGVKVGDKILIPITENTEE